jgi:methyl-accepting chemotaxis protein/methyl-accepting chemotaxis protein-1 (serine sensor receptor)
MFGKAKVSAKLLIGFGMMFAVALFLSGAWFWQSRGLTQELEKAVNVMARKQQLAGQIGTAAAEMLTAENGIVLGSILQRGEAVVQSQQKFREQSHRMEQALADFRPLCDTATLSRVNALMALLASAASAHQEMMQYLEKQQFDVVQKTFDESVQPRLREISSQADNLVRQENDRLAGAADAAHERSVHTHWMIAGFMMLALAAAATVLGIVQQINSGLRDLAGEISTGAAQVATAAAQVYRASRSLAQCASQEETALEQTSSSMEEMSSVTHKNKDNSSATAGLMQESEKVVDAAERTVRELSASMHEISASGEKITQVVKVIDDIAFQTRILSLNAAVEAARAGASGAGFAVVADEVGRLAQQCADAARNTGEMIEDMVARVRDGGGKLGRAAETIQAVVQQTAKMKVLVDEVNVGSLEQSKGIDGVSKAVAQMQQIAQKTAADAQETASAGQELDSDAEALNKIVNKMHALVGGAKMEATGSTPSRTSAGSANLSFASADR